MQKHYTVNQVAEILNVSSRTVYRYINRGTLQATKTASGSIRISEEAVNTFLNGGETVSNSLKSVNLK